MKETVGIALIIITVAILGYLFYKLCAGLCDEIFKQTKCKCRCHDWKDWEISPFKCHSCNCKQNKK